MRSVSILMGSPNDWLVMKKGVDTLRSLGVPFSVYVASAHRDPRRVVEIASSARGRGVGAILCAAGMAAHLAGVVAAHTTLPVIGVPLSSGILGGQDALLSTVQMPRGIPVATVAVDGAVNAALLACQILAVEDQELAEELEALREVDRGGLRQATERVRAELETP
ncbi:MAG: 5-(carboxyamino)imidazole ribonucleotide mutase [Deltaproteobacteria bacterium]|nr:5-(carboxyamino)imidazole ribonucleotide mutase [Deltaproteobacteria bacterium]